MRLSDANLPHLTPPVARPTYDRRRLAPGVAHLGIGAFSRAHGLSAIDDCLNAGEAGWGVVAASLRSPATRDALAPQDGLYTLALRDTAGETRRVIGAITGLMVAPEAPERLLDVLTDPRIRIVSLTVTEKGYCVDLGSGGLRADHADVQHDLAHPGVPRSAPGFLVEAIARRRAAGTAPFTVLSCDNLPSNGATLHRVLQDFARLRDPDLARFIAEAIACPSSMVDRIVPATTDDDRAGISARLGAIDAWPVLGEPFFQWVIEDRFPAGRPQLERAGVEFVPDVAPFEHMKLRLLNGAHSSIAAIGRLAGFATVAETIADPLVARFAEAFWDEVTPSLHIRPAEARAYTGRLLARFGNAALQHKTAQIASDASQKVPQRILAGLAENLSAGRPVQTMVLAVAAFIRSCGGFDDAGQPLLRNDPVFEAWRHKPDQRSATPSAVVESFMTLDSVFGTALPRRPDFVQPLTEALAAIAREGVLATLARRFENR